MELKSSEDKAFNFYFIAEHKTEDVMFFAKAIVENQDHFLDFLLLIPQFSITYINENQFIEYCNVYNEKKNPFIFISKGNLITDSQFQILFQNVQSGKHNDKKYWANKESVVRFFE